MTILQLRWSAIVSLVGVLLLMTPGCVTADGGYGYDAGMGVDYYEPYGTYYGGWGPGYSVGPFRDGDHRQAHSSGHAYRSAPPSHSIPSIPSGSRSGGRHSH
jgi:hypothetical protein